MNQTFKEWFNRGEKLLSNIVSPASCVLCAGKSLEWSVCDECLQDLPWLTYGCPICATPMKESAICGECLATPPAFDSTYSALLYKPPINHLICDLKFRGKLANARLLGELMYYDLRKSGVVALMATFDLIVPVPLHHSRLRQRSFNQTAEIGRFLAKHLKLPLGHDVIRKVRRSSSQTELSMHKRRKMPQTLFRVTRDIPPRVLLIDDVMTTGTTVDTLARVLKKAGAETVHVLTVARTIRSGGAFA